MRNIGMCCIKYLLFAFNLLLSLTGIVIITLGCTIHAFYYHFEEFLTEKFYSPPILLIAVGIILFLVAFFGCCAAIKESTCMVMTYSVFLSVILILEVAAGIAGYALQEELQSILRENMLGSMGMYKYDKNIREDWDAIQSELQCCGVDSVEDWYKHGFSRSELPTSCCSGDYQFCNSLYRYKNGCVYAFEDVIRHSAVTLGGIALAVALIQIVAVCFACTLGRAIRREKTRRLLLAAGAYSSSASPIIDGVTTDSTA